MCAVLIAVVAIGQGKRISQYPNTNYLAPGDYFITELGNGRTNMNVKAGDMPQAIHAVKERAGRATNLVVLSSNSTQQALEVYGQMLCYPWGSASPFKVAIGPRAGQGGLLSDQTTQIGNSAGLYSQGDYMTQYGSYAGAASGIASGATQIGANAGVRGSNSTYAVQVGYNCGFNMNTGVYVTAVGALAGSTCSNGSFSVFIGGQSGGTGTRTNCVAIGYQAQCSSNNQIVIGTGQPICGNGAGLSNITAYATNTSNFTVIASGYADITNRFGVGTNAPRATIEVVGDSMFSRDGDQTATQIGQYAGANSTNKQWVTQIGAHAGEFSGRPLQSVQVGSYAGAQASNAAYAVQIGLEAGHYASAASYSVQIGAQSGLQSSNAQTAVQIGYEAGQFSEQALSSVEVGSYAGRSASNVFQATLLGSEAGYTSVDTRNSVMVGFQSGSNAVNAQSSIFIGANSASTAAEATNVIVLGENAKASGNNQIVLGTGQPVVSSNWWQNGLMLSNTLWLRATAGNPYYMYFWPFYRWAIEAVPLTNKVLFLDNYDTTGGAWQHLLGVIGGTYPIVETIGRLSAGGDTTSFDQFIVTGGSPSVTNLARFGTSNNPSLFYISTNGAIVWGTNITTLAPVLGVGGFSLWTSNGLGIWLSYNTNGWTSNKFLYPNEKTYGALMMDAQVTTNAFGGGGTVFTNIGGYSSLVGVGFTGKITEGTITNSVPGYYSVSHNVSWLSASDQYYEFSFLTNDVLALPTFRQGTNASIIYANGSAHGLIYLPANTRCSLGCSTWPSDTAVTIYRASLVIEAK